MTQDAETRNTKCRATKQRRVASTSPPPHTHTPLVAACGNGAFRTFRSAKGGTAAIRKDGDDAGSACPLHTHLLTCRPADTYPPSDRPYQLVHHTPAYLPDHTFCTDTTHTVHEPHAPRCRR
eukprot:NODE_2188_length_821_cov_277.571244_g1481_i1.p1 GENE.NODE_2188_length_821_cov_277.571244_g1481_i1~~NODE_2188_length_821_cov_277.571244_g1481_i1.p1  ORF type:complete len:122 (-),score=3.78 NODE_2188_length_821_cov_277.571244_g1481_i1:35-400(-)